VSVLSREVVCSSNATYSPPCRLGSSWLSVRIFLMTPLLSLRFTLASPYVVDTTTRPYLVNTSLTPYVVYTSTSSSNPYIVQTSATPYFFFHRSLTPYIVYTLSTPFIVCTSMSPCFVYTSLTPYPVQERQLFLISFRHGMGPEVPRNKRVTIRMCIPSFFMPGAWSANYENTKVFD
jgi:hypothetical protein